MKVPRLICSVSTFVLSLLALLSIAGCSSPKAGYQQAEKAGDKMADLRKDIQSIKAAINETTTAMDSVVAQAAIDPRKSFDQLTKAVKNLEQADYKARVRAEQMRDEGRLFFEQWQQEIATVKNPQVQELAKQRQAELDRTFRNISKVTIQVKDDLNPWIADVKDVQTFLSHDLTTTGIEAIANIINKAKTRSVVVKEGLEVLEHELNIVETAITPARAASKSARAY